MRSLQQLLGLLHFHLRREGDPCQCWLPHRYGTHVLWCHLRGRNWDCVPFPGSWCEVTCPASQQQNWDSIQACAVVKALSGHCTRPSTCTHDHEKTEQARMRPRRQRGPPMGGGRLEAELCVCPCQSCLQWSACEYALETGRQSSAAPWLQAPALLNRASL